MCQIFAGQDPANYAYISRSVRLGGHATSIRLEATFWDLLDEIAASQGMTTPRFLCTLHEEVLELHGEISNFASLLRVACLLHLRAPQQLTENAMPGRLAALTSSAAE
jgi:predicted DNA-binding ribbon-helix-helix protein